MSRLSKRLWINIVLALCWVGIVMSSTTTQVAKTTIPIPNHFQNVKVLRVLDARNHIVQEEIGIRAKNIAETPVSEYYYTIPASIEQHVASITAFLRKQQKISLTIEKAGFDSEKEIQLYKVILDQPLQPQEDIRLGIHISYTHVLKPLPAKIPQVARQLLLYRGNVYLYSPYASKEMKTTLQVPTALIVSFTGGDGLVQQKGNKLVYGPLNDLEPYAYHELQCHFESLGPLITVTNLERDLQVSHWGNNLAVEEHYTVRNDGAGLDDNFNRAQYMRSAPVHGSTNMLKEISLELPVGASDAYFRDEIGNVSTSHFRNERTRSLLEIKPRYPVFGGWTYNWYHGYNVKLRSFLRYQKSTGDYILNVNFVDNAKNMAIDKARVRIVLPEGATDVKIYPNMDLDYVQEGKHFTNFDSTGRYEIILEKKNVVYEHQKPIQITYKYPTYRLLQKPLVVSASLLSLFVLSIIVSKLPFSINDTKQKSNLKKE
ncbi:Ribophorin I [Halteromyces radiatus]|uniref:Ribophorin I n=1 Tax=Halteromyces radiatus TaxID=101107 RepID=UPI0022201B78|nr:Ribophorin I [Halteromyces radiatus]KAI8097180.1 Ribophorin I [Halteromyces radiatus]